LKPALTTVPVLALALAGCSFTTATGFEECTKDTECGATGACVQHFCLPLPDGCRRETGGFDKADRIAIAALLPLTSADGGLVDRETYRLYALRLALEEANKAGGLKNRPFALFVCNAWKDDDATAQAYTRWLITNLQVPAIIVSGSDRLRAAAQEPTRVDAGTFLISANATNPGLAAVHKATGNVWRVAPDDSLQARVLAGVVASQLPPDASVAIVYESTGYGNGLAQPLADSLADAGLTPRSIVFDRGLDETHALVSINELVRQPPAATVLIAFPPDVVQLVTVGKTRTLLQVANGHRWFTADSAKDPAILTAATRTELEGLLGTAPAQGQGSAYRTFHDSFGTWYHVAAENYSFTAHSYDAMWLTLGSLASASGGELSGPRMRNGIANMSKPGTSVPLVSAKWTDLSLALAGGGGVNADGSSGDLQFDLEAGSPSSPYEVWAVTDGGVTTRRYVNP
jgi:branched-chain amino acid transport system substrate-binding protein